MRLRRIKRLKSSVLASCRTFVSAVGQTTLTRLKIRLVSGALFICFHPTAFCQIYGKVVSVSDGDTFTMLTANNKQVKVRLHGIDCPEKSQDYGHLAKQYTSELVFGRYVHVVITDTDQYSRLVGKVFLDDDETCLNEELLKAGMAWHYKKYDTSTYWGTLEVGANDRKKVFGHKIML